MAITGVALGPFQDRVSRATQALALLAVVIVTALVGGRRPAYMVAAAATVCYMLLLPPVGSLRVHLGDDVVSVVVLAVSATLVARLVAVRIETLDRIEQQRAVLLRSVSHDLRTPLSAIKAATSEMGEDEPHDERARRRLLALITSEAERLDRLVANLLSFSRIEAGALVPRVQSVDIAELVGVGCERLGGVFAGQVHLLASIEEDLPAVDADYLLLDQVLTNLVENAVRHSPPGGDIRVSASRSGASVRIVVADGGPGVAPSERRAIFEPFRSGSVAGASGIGLAICRAIIEAHGGTIAVGEGPGGGAEFTIELPAS